VYDTDEEQIEALKKWWMANGNMLIGGLLIAVIAYFGINFYKDTRLAQKEAASSVYQSLVELATETQSLSGDKLAEANASISTLKKDYADSTYAIYASLYSAKLAVESGDLDLAASELNWALDQKIPVSLQQLIQLRLARIEFARGNEGAALKLLSNESGQQKVGFEEVRGDILLSQGDTDGARLAYQNAFEAAQAANLQRPVLEMKLNDLVAN